MNLKMQMFLKVNRRFWNENLVDKEMNDARFASNQSLKTPAC